MPKHRKKQHWNDWPPGFQRNNRQSANNSQRNIGQDLARNFYDNPHFQNHYTGNYSNNHFDSSYQRSFTQNHDQSNFNQNYHTQNARNTEFNPNFQRNSTQISNKSINDVQLAQYQRDLEQNTSTKNDRKKSVNITNPWYKNKQDTPSPKTDTPPKKGRKRMPKGHFAVNYYKKTENFTEKGYIIKETLYKDPGSFYANANLNTDPPSNCEASDNWTDTFWQKHDDSSLEDSRTSRNTGKVSRKNQNRLERTLNDMLAKPAEMSKGKSLLQKMGWQGGGLGRDGDGITEPIAPKATYAVNTIGLGHLTEKPKKPVSFANMSKKKLQKPEFRNNFCANVLLYILEFVKSDEENKIVFEPRLSKMERKRIHQIVEKIRVSDNLDDFENFENFSDKHLKLVKDIWVHNCYELWTESEGERENRRLCLFKEAPAHVYLVTPEDLTENDESNDKNENDDESDDIKKEKVKVSDTTTSSKKKCDSNLKEDVKNNCNDVKKKISEWINSQLDKNNQILVKHNTPGNTEPIGYVCKEIIPKMEINDEIIIISDGSDSEDEMATNIHKKDEIMKENQQIVEEANICNDIIVRMEINEQNTKNKGSITDTTTDINEDVKTTLEKYDDHANEITVQMEINEQNTKTDENISDTTTKINIHDDVKPKLENREHTYDIAVKMEITEQNTKMDQKVSKKDTNINNDDSFKHKVERDDCDSVNKILFNQKEDQKDTKEGVLAKIVKYFKEFSSDETFKEFRFLGPFKSDELMHINVFFDICMKQDDIECDEKYELLAAFDNDSVKFDVLEDNNGKKFIKKVGDSPELASEDEEVVYASGVYL